MAVSDNALSRILSGARALCSPEGDRLINEHRNGGGGIGMDYFDRDDDDFVDPYSCDYDEQMEKKNQNPNVTKEPVISENKLANSKLPAAIRESFRQKQIDTNRLSNISVLDQLPEAAKKKISESVKKDRDLPQRQTINEQRYAPAASFDYTALKAVMKECIEEYFSKHPLNEETSIKQLNLKKGNIDIIDSRGRMFSAKLVYQGNINEDVE